MVMTDGRTKTAGRMLASPADTPAKARFVGVDVARGIALISMLATNVFVVLNDDGTPTLTGMTVTGRAATLFVMVAGISLAFITGGRHPVQGRARRAAAASIAVRALLIGAIGLALGYTVPADMGMILPYYGLFFLLAIPLIGLRPRTLAWIAGVLVVVGPLILLGASSLGLDATWDAPSYPTFSAPFTQPIDFVLQLLVTGEFPAVVYMIYICAGLAIGRLNLSSTKVAVRLLVGGLVMAFTAWFTSSVILFHLGGLQHLQAAAADDGTPLQVTNVIVWDPENQVASWWWLAIRAHHTGTPIDALHTLGSAIAVLGAVLLVTKLRAARRLLWPVGVAGTMTLTIYSASALVMASGLLSDNLGLLYWVEVAGAIIFAVVWHRFMGQGPLERMVAMGAGRARLAVMARPPRRRANTVHNQFTKRTIGMAVGVGIVLAGGGLAGGGVAYASWSASGTGAGTAATGDTMDFTFTSTVDETGLTPGGPPEDVAFTVTNPGTGSKMLAAVAVTVADATGTAWGADSDPAAPEGCSADDYTVGDVTITPGQIAGGAHLDGTVSMTMNNLSTDQDACKGQTIPLYFAAS